MNVYNAFPIYLSSEEKLPENTTCFHYKTHYQFKAAPTESDIHMAVQGGVVFPAVICFGIDTCYYAADGNLLYKINTQTLKNISGYIENTPGNNLFKEIENASLCYVEALFADAIAFTKPVNKTYVKSSIESFSIPPLSTTSADSFIDAFLEVAKAKKNISKPQPIFSWTVSGKGVEYNKEEPIPF